MKELGWAATLAARWADIVMEESTGMQTGEKEDFMEEGLLAGGLLQF